MSSCAPTPTPFLSLSLSFSRPTGMTYLLTVTPGKDLRGQYWPWTGQRFRRREKLLKKDYAMKQHEELPADGWGTLKRHRDTTELNIAFSQGWCNAVDIQEIKKYWRELYCPARREGFQGIFQSQPAIGCAEQSFRIGSVLLWRPCLPWVAKMTKTPWLWMLLG